MAVRKLVLVLGDQLDRWAAVFDDFDAARDAVWMAEVERELTHVWCHKLRIAFFLSAMRHFRDELREQGLQVHYHELSSDPERELGKSFTEVLTSSVRELAPERLVITQPGDARVLAELRDAAASLEIPLEVISDRHFFCTFAEFDGWADGKRSLVLESFYRLMRNRHGILMHGHNEPEGGRWNFDEENRDSFSATGPERSKPPRRFHPDAITQEVLALVAERFAAHPGSLEHFELPVTHAQALALLRDFVEHRLPQFGRFQDAMWPGREFLYHSRLSALLNTKLLSPRKAVEAAVTAYHDGAAPLNAVEGFVRQILGWREFVRGVYWRYMPDYQERNALRADREVPGFFWNGETDMACVRDAMQSVIEHGYAHHIQRLMVLGLFSQLLGVHPRKFHEWHMAMYIDAIDWVSLPNALGMSQWGDGGLVGTKPYCASGNYIKRMSGYCRECRYEPRHATGANACPFTTLYWDFLARHCETFSDNRRMAMQLRNLERKSAEELEAIRAQARSLTARVTRGERI